MPRKPRRSGGPGSLFVDTSAWLAFFSARDSRHADADRLFREAVASKVPLITTNLVMAELHRLLLIRAGIAPALAAIRTIQQSIHVSVSFSDEALHDDALRWLERLPDQTITYTDATSFAMMERSKCKWALSFDHDFVLAGYWLWVGE